jgi:hypothetical protein
MQELEQSRTEQDDHALEQAAINEPEAAIERQPPVQAVPPVASFEALTGQQQGPAVEGPKGKAAESQPDNTTAITDAGIEQLAHGMVDKELDDKDEEYLASQGYRALPVIRGQHEFVMRTFVPTQGGRAPIVSFRGTVPSKIDTLIADVDPSGIGMYQFNPNRSLIEGQMRAAASHGKVISAGHSLGGALAQIAAAAFTDCVGRIVTFQAPGVSREMAQQIVNHNEQNPDEAIESSHHRVANDLVPLGGQALTPGMVHNHQMTGGNMLSRNPLAAHLAFPLAQEEKAKGNELPHQTEQQVVPTGDETTEHANEEKTQLVELARRGLGHLIFGTGAVINGIGGAISSIFNRGD